MTIQERVQELFNKFNVNLTVEATRTELAEATLENGTVIYTDGDDFVEDGEAYIINDEGERIPLPPGDYTLADGGVISIGDVGKINKVQKPVSDGKGDAKGADGKPANVPNIDVTKPAKKKDKGDGGGDGGGKSGKKGKNKLSSNEDQTTDMKVELNAEQVLAMLKERFPDLGEDVAQAIAVAVEEIYTEPEVEAEKEKDEDEEMGYKDKEEMEVNPEAPKAEEAVEVEVEVEVEEEEEKEEEKEELSAQRSEIDKLKEALAQTNERIEQLQKLSAHSGLKHKAPTKKVEPLNLSNMTLEERVRALANQFNK